MIFLLKPIKTQGAIPRLLDIRELGLPVIREQYLGVLEGTDCFSIELPQDAKAPEGMEFVDLRQAYSEMSEGCFELVNKAVQVMEWTGQTSSAAGAEQRPRRNREKEERNALNAESFSIPEFRLLL